MSTEHGRERRRFRGLPLLALGVAAILAGACRDDASENSPAPGIPGAEQPIRAHHASRDTTRPGTPREGLAPTQRIGPRLVRAEAFDTLWQRGGAVDDTLLLHPVSLKADDSLVYVYDHGAMRIAAFDAATGDVRWTFGRSGGGPGEFRHVHLARGPAGGVRILDVRNQRFTDIAPDGQLVREWPGRVRRIVSHICALADGTTLVADVGHEPPGVLQLGPAEDTLRFIQLPWADLDTIESLALQAKMAPLSDGSGCIFAFVMGRGFSRIEPDGAVYTTPYVEDFELAPTVTTAEGVGIRTSFTNAVVYATSNPSVDRDTLVVLFIGPYRSDHRERFLDHYDAGSGAYLYSRLLDAPAKNAVRVNGTYFIVTFDGDYPALIALRPRP